MIKIANNLTALSLHKAATVDSMTDLLKSPTAVGVGSGLIGSGVGAGLFHLLAKKQNKTLLNYLLAAAAGGVPAGLAGSQIPQLIDSFNFIGGLKGKTQEERIANEIARSKAEAAEELAAAEADAAAEAAAGKSQNKE